MIQTKTIAMVLLLVIATVGATGILGMGIQHHSPNMLNIHFLDV
ncbi:MAG: hypothetical protein WAM14_00110 [Candidatus Nitrosopolaris sp.]|jgi:hypothetical protein